MRGSSPCFVPRPEPAPPGDERVRLRWPPGLSTRPEASEQPRAVRGSQRRRGRGRAAGVRGLAGLSQGLSDGCAESQAGSAAPGCGRFGESGGKRAQRTVRQQIRVIVVAGGASQEVSGFAELIGERCYF